MLAWLSSAPPSLLFTAVSADLRHTPAFATAFSLTEGQPVASLAPTFMNDASCHSGVVTGWLSDRQMIGSAFR
jgi:predicted FMN-binding regulatory protein PaiB